jgi:hypothetical protein
MSELYRCLKRQALRAYLTSSLIFRNCFIRNHLWSFLGGQIINLAATIGYILRGNPGRTSLDLYPYYPTHRRNGNSEILASYLKS